MSEITTTKLMNEDRNDTDGERSENSCDSSENISSQGDGQEIPLEQQEQEEKPLEYVASVDVTVESSPGCEDDSSSNTGSEGEKDSEGVANEDTTSAKSKESENDQDQPGEDSDGDVDGESVTCALLGQQAKVNLIR